MEKVFSILVWAFVASLLIFMWISAFHYVPKGSIFSNVYARNCAHAKLWQRIVGVALQLASGYIFYQCWLGMKAGDAGSIPLAGVLLAAGFYLYGHPFSYSSTVHEDEEAGMIAPKKKK
jgi:hypothetical protein